MLSEQSQRLYSLEYGIVFANRSTKEAESFSQDKTRSSLDIDRELVLALVKCIEIIGEAATNQDIKRIPRRPTKNPLVKYHLYEEPAHSCLFRHQS